MEYFRVYVNLPEDIYEIPSFRTSHDFRRGLQHCSRSHAAKRGPGSPEAKNDDGKSLGMTDTHSKKQSEENEGYLLVLCFLGYYGVLSWKPNEDSKMCHYHVP